MSVYLRTGLGFDAHRFVSDRPLVLGGLRLGFGPGLAGHSDGDALLHAIADALLGSLALPDIGTLFPDDDPAYAGADSGLLLTEVVGRFRAAGGRLISIDTVIICDRPRLQPHLPAIRSRLADLLGIAPNAIGLKAKTTEGTALAQPGVSLAALVVALVEAGR